MLLQREGSHERGFSTLCYKSTSCLNSIHHLRFRVILGFANIKINLTLSKFCYLCGIIFIRFINLVQIIRIVIFIFLISFIKIISFTN